MHGAPADAAIKFVVNLDAVEGFAEVCKLLKRRNQECIEGYFKMAPWMEDDHRYSAKLTAFRATQDYPKPANQVLANFATAVLDLFKTNHEHAGLLAGDGLTCHVALHVSNFY